MIRVNRKGNPMKPQPIHTVTMVTEGYSSVVTHYRYLSDAFAYMSTRAYSNSFSGSGLLTFAFAVDMELAFEYVFADPDPSVRLEKFKKFDGFLADYRTNLDSIKRAERRKRAQDKQMKYTLSYIKPSQLEMQPDDAINDEHDTLAPIMDWVTANQSDCTYIEVKSIKTTPRLITTVTIYSKEDDVINGITTKTVVKRQ